ncbi:MAG TPA: thioesterase family protein [Mycobacteriales bacterium]|nr:thioesterase family protein [Mycobacteriales bacterium]
MGEHEYAGRLHPGYGVGDKPNGGYLVALSAQAAIADLEGRYPHAFATSSHFLSAPPWESEVRVRVDPLRSGRRVAQARTTLVDADGTPCVESLVTLGTLSDDAQPWYDDAPVFAIPDEDACFLMPTTPPGAPFVVHILGVVEERMDPACLGNPATGAPSGHADWRGWARLVGDEPWDASSLLLAVDCFPPATIPLGSFGWVPTLELTAYVRAQPAPGPLRIRQRTRLIEDGWLDESCDVWDSRGRLVAQATQLAGVRIPEGQRPAPRT